MAPDFSFDTESWSAWVGATLGVLRYLFEMTLHSTLLSLFCWLHGVFWQKQLMVFSHFCFTKRQSTASSRLLKGGEIENLPVSTLKKFKCTFKTANLTGDATALSDFSGGKPSSRSLQFAAFPVFLIQLFAESTWPWSMSPVESKGKWKSVPV